MKYRKLQIAWSVVWGLLAVLLIVLWIANYPGNSHVFGEYWMPLLIVFTLALASWVRLRFRMDSLLIATTLVAIVLGLVVYCSRG